MILAATTVTAQQRKATKMHGDGRQNTTAPATDCCSGTCSVFKRAIAFGSHNSSSGKLQVRKGGLPPLNSNYTQASVHISS